MQNPGLIIIFIGVISLGFAPIKNDTGESGNNGLFERSTSEHDVWKKVSFGIRESKVRCVTAHPKDSSVLFAGTSSSVYKSANRGKDHSLVLQVPGSDREVNFLYISDNQAHDIFAASDSGLFQSRDAGRTWEKNFYANDPQERQCLSVVTDENKLYVGTMRGLFIKNNGSSVWQKAKGELSNSPVYFLDKDNENIYIATDQEVFRINNGDSNLKKIYSVISGEQNGALDSENGLAESSKQIKYMSVTSGDTAKIYIATSRGIFESLDQGASWHRLNIDGLPLDEITSLIAAGKNGLFVGTNKGVFRYKTGRWNQIYKGMETNKITFLARDREGGIYAATDKGLFILNGSHEILWDPAINYQNIESLFAHEPPIIEIQKMAINYAEVNPEKIKSWRVLAKKKAWLPSLSMGFDGNKNRTTSDSLWGSYSSGGQHYLGPDDKTFYNNFGWDVSLSWDFADLIWSTDQTTIESRSKLMVELREDILDQITRLYFERRRTQFELKIAQTIEPQLRIDREMRVAELTALIDALTGGEFSRKIKNQKSKTKNQ